MHHIQGDHRVKWSVVLHAPYPFAHVDRDRRMHIGEPFVGRPRLDAGARGRVGSLGSQTSLGSALAKQTTCSPVPDPISSTMPFFGRTRISTSRIGPQLRAADGENCRASPPQLRSLTGSGAGDDRLSTYRMPSRILCRAKHTATGSFLSPASASLQFLLAFDRVHLCWDDRIAICEIRAPLLTSANTCSAPWGGPLACDAH